MLICCTDCAIFPRNVYCLGLWCLPPCVQVHLHVDLQLATCNLVPSPCFKRHKFVSEISTRSTFPHLLPRYTRVVTRKTIRSSVTFINIHNCIIFAITELSTTVNTLTIGGLGGITGSEYAAADRAVELFLADANQHAEKQMSPESQNMSQM
jgi:hypothetical protein